jgi:hypothetical protein
MPTERELLALCLKWIQNPQGDAFDKAMLIEAVQAKLQPRPWVGLTGEDQAEISDRLGLMSVAWLDLMDAVEAKLKEKNT